LLRDDLDEVVPTTGDRVLARVDPDPDGTARK
jgi:hypothetical protein